MDPRLDDGESIFFTNQLRAIDKIVYEIPTPANLSRSLIPSVMDVPETAKAYTYRLVKRWGRAKVGGSLGDDAPRVEWSGEELSQVITNVTDSYAYDVLEIREAKRVGQDLDVDRARGARLTIEDEIDNILAVGNGANNLKGLLNQSTSNFVELHVLDAGALGFKSWLKKTPREILADLQGMANKLVGKLKQGGAGAGHRFTVTLSTAQYSLLLQPIGSNTDKTILKFIQDNDPRLAEIVQWHRCDGAGAGGTSDRICMYVKDSTVLGALVPMEFNPQAPQPKNMQYVINCLARCGGVVVRYPVAMLYADEA
jgi:hypothetical protein